MDRVHLSEDTVSQSGWVFADLLVALSVIFLATISFIPATQTALTPVPIESEKLAKANGFLELYEGPSVTQLLTDIKEFRSSNSIPETVEVIQIQIFASSSINNGRAGILDALEFSIAIQNQGLEEFQDVSISIDESERLKPGQLMVRAVFGANQP